MDWSQQGPRELMSHDSLIQDNNTVFDAINSLFLEISALSGDLSDYYHDWNNLTFFHATF